MNKAQVRNYPVTVEAVEIRETDDVPVGIVVGYASMFDVTYNIGAGFRERIEKGAFADTIKERAPFPIFYQHDWSDPIGVTSKIEEDDRGLRFEARLFIEDGGRARSVFRAMEAGALREFSIGFIPTEIRRDEEDGSTIETITAASLLEISSVVKGANPDTETVAVRFDEFEEEEEVEEREDDLNEEITLPDYVADRLDSEYVRSLLRDSF